LNLFSETCIFALTGKNTYRYRAATSLSRIHEWQWRIYGGCDGAIAPPFEKVFGFFPTKANEKQMHTSSFFAYDRAPALPKS
jgi:hypothetical protein